MEYFSQCFSHDIYNHAKCFLKILPMTILIVDQVSWTKWHPIQKLNSEIYSTLCSYHKLSSLLEAQDPGPEATDSGTLVFLSILRNF